MEKVQMFLIQKMTQKRMVKGNDYEVFTVVTLLLYRCCKREIFCYKGLNKCLPDFVFYFNFLFIFLLFFLKFWRGGGMIFGCMCIELQMVVINENASSLYGVFIEFVTTHNQRRLVM